MLLQKKQPVRILGIDPGTAIVGWGMIDVWGSTQKAVAYGHISTSSKDTPYMRLCHIVDDLREIITFYKPQEAAVEELFFLKNITTAIAVAQARGVILLTIVQNGVIVHEYTPLQIKQSLTGYGHAEKKQVQMMVKKALHLSTIPKPDDTADALAIALCHSVSRKSLFLKGE